MQRRWETVCEKPRPRVDSSIEIAKTIDIYISRRRVELNQIIPCDAYRMAEVHLTQPLQIVVGSKWMSDDLFARAASSDKKVLSSKGRNT